jgi:RND family efflux transporter MFP subunit
MKTKNTKYKGMKTAAKLLAVLLVVSCGMSKDQMIKKQIESKKAQIIKLEKKIEELENELSDTTEKRTTIAVQIKEIKPEVFKHYITVFGNVEADKYAKVSPEMNGQIRTIHVQEGQRISKGQLLVSLINDATQSSINEAKASLELANITYEKQKSLWDQGIGSEIQFLQAKTQRQAAEDRLKMLEAQLRMSQVRAPFDGIVDKIFPKVGDIAGPMVPVVELVNLSRLTIKADVSESYVGMIHPGDKVEVSFSSMPGETLNATIKRTTKVINPTNRTFQVELNISNPGEKIRPNMIASIRINDFTSEKAFIVPSIVVKRDITGDYLYLAVDEENDLIAKKRYLERGISYEGNTMITKGLKEGDKVVVAGYNLVSSGTYLVVK